MAQNEAITVITVCRNAIDGLKVTSESVSQQKWDNLRHIVVDGASTDGTLDFLQAETGRFSAWVSEPDHGIYNAMNKGINLCPDNGWVIFLNAGDTFYSEDIIQKMRSYFSSKCHFIFGGVAILSPCAKFQSVFPVSKLSANKMPGCHQSQFTRAAWLKRHQFDETYPVGADFEFYLRGIREGAKVGLVAEIVSIIAPEGFSARNENQLQSDYTRAINCHIGRVAALRWLWSREIRRLMKGTIKLAKSCLAK